MTVQNNFENPCYVLLNAKFKHVNSEKTVIEQCCFQLGMTPQKIRYFREISALVNIHYIIVIWLYLAASLGCP